MAGYRYKYGEAWNPALLELGIALTENEARSRHDTDGYYVAACWKNDAPYAMIHHHAEEGRTWFVVEFLDKALNKYLSYSFDHYERELLRLSRSTYRLFKPIELRHRFWLWHQGIRSHPPVTHRVFDTTEFIFNSDGVTRVRQTSINWRKKSRTQSWETDEPPPSLFEPVPAFGRYEGLLRKER